MPFNYATKSITENNDFKWSEEKDFKGTGKTGRKVGLESGAESAIVGHRPAIP